MSGNVIYTTIIHSKRRELGLSLSEYCLVDMIDKMSNKPDFPFCTMRQPYFAAELDVSLRTLATMIKKVVELGLVEQVGHKYRSLERWHKSIHGAFQDSANSSEFGNRNKQNLQNSQNQDEQNQQILQENSANFAETNNKELKTKKNNSVPNGTWDHRQKKFITDQEIQWLFDEFKSVVGFKSDDKNDRRNARKLLKEFTCEQLTDMLNYCDKFEWAPVVSSITQLWTKRNDIRASVKRQELKQRNQMQRDYQTSQVAEMRKELVSKFSP